MRKKRLFLILVALITVLNLTLPSSVHACSGSEGYNLQIHALQSDVILEGYVLELFQFHRADFGLRSQYPDYTVIVQVNKYFKGSGPKYVMVSGFGQGTDCITWIEKSQSFVIFAAGNTRGFLEASTYSVGDAARTTEWYEVEELIRTSGQQPVFPTEQNTVSSVIAHVYLREILKQARWAVFWSIDYLRRHILPGDILLIY